MVARVIVFGPTGNVGSIAARTAQRQGGKVFLAMRNPQRQIPGLTAIGETNGGFERVQADLLDPQSVASAVEHTKATKAFMYLAHGTTDHMRATLEAAKAAGISFIVFLSSFTIQGDLQAIKQTDRIPYIHARVEMNLEELYGSRNYVALRAGAFATNTLRWKAGIGAGQMKLDSPDTEYDYITPIDMGRVAGNILVKGQRDGQYVVYLYGPRLVAQMDAIATLITALGKGMKIVSGNDQEILQEQSASKAEAKDVAVTYGPEEKKSTWFASAYSNHEEGIRNVLKYTGKPGTEYKEWVKGNVSGFAV